MLCLYSNGFLSLLALIHSDFSAIQYFFNGEQIWIIEFNRRYFINCEESYTVVAGQAELLDQSGQQDLAAASDDHFLVSFMEFNRILQHIHGEAGSFECETGNRLAIIIDRNVQCLELTQVFIIREMIQRCISDLGRHPLGHIQTDSQIFHADPVEISLFVHIRLNVEHGIAGLYNLFGFFSRILHFTGRSSFLETAEGHAVHGVNRTDIRIRFLAVNWLGFRLDLERSVVFFFIFRNSKFRILQGNLHFLLAVLRGQGQDHTVKVIQRGQQLVRANGAAAVFEVAICFSNGYQCHIGHGEGIVALSQFRLDRFQDRGKAGFRTHTIEGIGGGLLSGFFLRFRFRIVQNDLDFLSVSCQSSKNSFFKICQSSDNEIVFIGQNDNQILIISGHFFKGIVLPCDFAEIHRVKRTSVFTFFDNEGVLKVSRFRFSGLFFSRLGAFFAFGRSIFILFYYVFPVSRSFFILIFFVRVGLFFFTLLFRVSSGFFFALLFCIGSGFFFTLLLSVVNGFFFFLLFCVSSGLFFFLLFRVSSGFFFFLLF